MGLRGVVEQREVLPQDPPQIDLFLRDPQPPQPAKDVQRRINLFQKFLDRDLMR